jgi:hypothetical protein
VVAEVALIPVLVQRLVGLVAAEMEVMALLPLQVAQQILGVAAEEVEMVLAAVRLLLVRAALAL